MNLLRKLSVGAFALLGIAAGSVHAAPLTVREGNVDEFNFFAGGYGGTSDTTIYYSSANPTYMRTNSGQTTTLSARGGTTNNRDLLRFNLSGLGGQSVTVNSATLTMTRITTNGTSPNNFTFSFYQVAPSNAAWVEGNGKLEAHNPLVLAGTDVATTSGDPTWYYRAIDTNANTSSLPGSDTTSTRWTSGDITTTSTPSTSGLFNTTDLVDADTGTAGIQPVSSLALDVGGPTNTAFSVPLPAALVQSWIDSAGDNAGLLITNGTGTAIRLASSESATSGFRPTLNLDVTVTPEPASLGLLGFAALAMVRRRRA